MKKYPDYEVSDLQFVGADGDSEPIEFSAFIGELHRQNELENDIERGVVAFVNSKGTKGLSDKQGQVLDIIVSRYDNKVCRVCEARIPLTEVLEDNDGLCSYHKYQFDKQSNS